MKDFEETINILFKKLSTHETIEALDVKTLNKKFHDFLKVFELKTQVLNPSGIGMEITLYLCFDISFPLDILTIYLSDDSYDSVKYIPHVNSDRSVCTFDKENVLINSEEPYLVVLECIKRAKNIIEDGLAKKNFQDFEDEFLSYWDFNYDDQGANRSMLSLIDENPDKVETKLLVLKKKIRVFWHVLYQESPDNIAFKKFLEDSKCEYEEIDLFYAGELDNFKTPPFVLTNKDAINLIYKLGDQKAVEFKKKLKNNTRGMFVLFKKIVNTKTYYLGWFHTKPNLTRDGFRPGAITPEIALTTFQSQEKVRRVLPMEYSNKRINARTAGIKNEMETYKFCIAGIGSIGSNLVPYLNSLPNPEFRLIDGDLLSIENMGRHFLGFNSVSAYKTEGLKSYLTDKNPKQNVLTFQTSIVDVFTNNKNVINGSDFVFVAIGKINIEDWLANKIRSGEIIKPTFILWVEPYLLGGHCIYISPKDFKYEEFYFEEKGNKLFKYNVVCSNEYKNENNLLSLKEAGCQTNYTPYSGSNVTLFLSSLYPKILKIIASKSERSVAFSWIGDKELATKMEIKLSTFGNANQSFTIIENNV